MFVFFHFGCNMLCWSGVSSLVHLGSQVLVTSKSQTLLVPQDFHWSSNRSEPAMKETDGDCSWHLFCCEVMVCSVSIFFRQLLPFTRWNTQGYGSQRWQCLYLCRTGWGKAQHSHKNYWCRGPVKKESSAGSFSGHGSLDQWEFWAMYMEKLIQSIEMLKFDAFNLHCLYISPCELLTQEPFHFSEL